MTILDDKYFGCKKVNAFLYTTGCVFAGKCKFCTYHQFKKEDYLECITANRGLIEAIPKNIKGIIEIAPSASIFEIPFRSLEYLRDTIKDSQFEMIITESHFYYRNLIKNFKNWFAFIPMKVKIGVETFDNKIRAKMGKNFQIDSLDDLRKYTDSILLIGGLNCQTIKSVKEDLKIGCESFGYVEFTVLDTKDEKLKNPVLLEWIKENIGDYAKKYPNLRVYNNISEFVGG